MPDQIFTSVVDVIADILESNPDISYLTFATYPQKFSPVTSNDLCALQGTLLRHKENDDYPPVPRSMVRKEDIIRMCNEVPSQKCLAIRSKVIVTTSVEPKFIPMLDFLCEKNDDNLQLLIKL
jgi:hypothetical protein